MKILRTASLGSNFTGSYKKKCIDVKCKKWDLTIFSNFFLLFFHNNKRLGFGKIFKSKPRTKSGLLSHRT